MYMILCIQEEGTHKHTKASTSNINLLGWYRKMLHSKTTKRIPNKRWAKTLNIKQRTNEQEVGVEGGGEEKKEDKIQI